MEHLKNFSFYAILFIQVIFNLPCLGQAPVPFHNDDFNIDPHWQGDIEDFAINDQLQLMAQEAGKSYLSRPSAAINDAVWEIYVEFGFNPSSSNYANLYLVSDSHDLSAPLNGYFVMVGGNLDEISLYKQQGQKISKIIDGVDKKLDSNKVRAKIKVTRSRQGKWKLWSAVEDTTQYQLEGEVEDRDILSSLYAGVFCTYTATRTDKFYFDDFKITGEAFVDTIPPAILNVKCISYNVLQISFFEPLDPSSIENLANFKITPNGGIAQTIVLETPNTVLLSFQQSFKMGSIYTLSVENIADTAANKAQKLTEEFLFFLEGKATFGEVVINELMVNPSPKVGLPEAEYMELLNTGKEAFNLSDWHIADDKSRGALNNYLLLPGEYLILCALKDTVLFKKYGNTMGISPWPTLNNDADNISLTNQDDQLIDQVNYTKNWYKSTLRANGGYALEMIDPLNPCSQEDNWKASMHGNGGTPGQENSVFARKPDLSGPILEKVFPKSADSLVLYFNEVIDTAALASAEFFINKKLIKTNISADAVGPNAIKLWLEEPLEIGKEYVIEVFKIKDCNGNHISNEKNKASFGLLQDANSGDVVINEVLFNPNVNGVDFVEIYNNSAKYLNLKDWMLANIAVEKETGLEVTSNRKVFTKDDFLFAPRQFLVLTSSIDKTLHSYPQGKCFLEMSALPSYPDQEGTVIVLNDENQQIDRFDYTEQYHSPILSKKDGVSLERIAYDGPTQDPNNWASAAKTHSFATPGEYNSQSRKIGGFDGEIEVSPKVIAFGVDGFDDYTTIQYDFRNQSYTANVYVFDAEGRIVNKIAEQTTIGRQGFFTWKGVDDFQRRVKVGPYMIYIQVFSLNGEVKVFKEPIVVGIKL